MDAACGCFGACPRETLLQVFSFFGGRFSTYEYTILPILHNRTGFSVRFLSCVEVNRRALKIGLKNRAHMSGIIRTVWLLVFNR